MKMIGIQLSWVVVKDLQTAVKFYTDVLGLTLKEMNKEFGWAELAGPEGSILGIAQENPYNGIPPGANAVVSFSVANLDAARSTLLKKGTKLIGDVIELPCELRMQTFQDRDGNTFQLVEKLSPGPL